MSTVGTTINPNDVILSNHGYMKIDDIEIAELKDLEILLTCRAIKAFIILIGNR